MLYKKWDFSLMKFIFRRRVTFLRRKSVVSRHVPSRAIVWWLLDGRMTGWLSGSNAPHTSRGGKYSRRAQGEPHNSPRPGPTLLANRKALKVCTTARVAAPRMAGRNLIMPLPRGWTRRDSSAGTRQWFMPLFSPYRSDKLSLCRWLPFVCSRMHFRRFYSVTERSKAKINIYCFTFLNYKLIPIILYFILYYAYFFVTVLTVRILFRSIEITYTHLLLYALLFVIRIKYDSSNILL